MTTSLLKEAKETGLSLSHFEILAHIAEKGKMTMKEIASWLYITPPSASTLIKILVEKDLVERIQDNKGKDRRTVYIKINEKAHNLFHSIQNKKMPVFKKMLSKLSKEDKDDLARILIKCIHE